MATTKANLKQTAFNVAATLTSAYVGAGLLTSIEEASEQFTVISTSAFDELVKEGADAPSTRAGSGAGRGRAEGAKSGGGSRSSKKDLTLEQALDTEAKFGKFRGLTLGEVADLTADQADEDYGYTTGNGLKYIEWLAKSDDQFLQPHAKLILEDRREGGAE